MPKSLNKKGFTLLEILIAIFTVGILLVAAVVGYRSFESRVELDSTVNNAIATLQLAQERTVSSKGDMVYGVRFEQTFFTLFEGASYDEFDPNNEVFNLPSSVEFYDEWSNGRSIYFNRVSGSTDVSRDLVFRLANDTSETRTISVLPSGRVSLDKTVATTDTRVKDSRHLHFDLGWSIQDATTLTLNFTDAGVEEDINMSSFFNGSDSFYWEGTVNVSGEDQTLRVHTHSLDAFDTELSIHVDGRYVSEAVQILIDDKDIVSVDADSVATVGSFGGTMEVQ